MNKKTLQSELSKMGFEYNKIIFKAISPYQKRRYKSEFVGWEAWLYKNSYPCGLLLTQETFENKEYLQTYLENN